MGEIRFRQLSIGALWRIGLMCGGCLWFSLAVVFGVIALFGGTTVKFNQQPVTGIAGLGMALGFGVVFTLAGSIVMLAGAVVSRLFLRFFGDWRLRLVDAAQPAAPEAARPATRNAGSPDETEMGW